MAIGQPTLDQLRLFLAVVDEGSFNRAARKLGRAISVVSYGIAGLEAQLNVRLFDREGSRRPELTEAVARDQYFFRTLVRFTSGAPQWAHLNKVMAIACGQREAGWVRLDLYRLT